MKPSQEKIWRKYYNLSDKVNPDVDCSAYHYIKNSFEYRKDCQAFHYFGKNISYPEMFAQIDRYANAFAGMGVKAGDNVTIIMPNTPEAAYFFYGLNKIGAVAIFVDPRMVSERVTYFVGISKSKVIVTLDLMYSKCLEAIDKYNVEHVIVASASLSLPIVVKMVYKLKASKVNIPYDDTVMSVKQWLARYEGQAVAEEAEYHHDSICAVVQTGGSTGTPKGCMLSNFAINSVARDILYVDVFREQTRRFLDIIPIFSSYGLVVGMHIPMTAKVHTTLIPNFKPEDFPDLLHKYKPNGVIAVPAFYDLWFDSKNLAKADMSYLCVCIAGGDKMTKEMENKATKFLNDRGGRYHVAQGYGMSEVSSVVSFSFENVNCKGSAGVPLYNATIGVFDPVTEEELDYNQEGEICVAGDTIMSGYIGMPEETSNVMRKHKDGMVWVHSGDVGYIDENGFIHVRSRMKQIIIKFDGHKVFPLQIENVVYHLPEVETCAVVGCRDLGHAAGHMPLIIVKRHPGKMSDADLRKKIMDYCKENIEERAMPCDAIFVEEMPLTGFGKIDSRALTEKYKRYDYTKHYLQ